MRMIGKVLVATLAAGTAMAASGASAQTVYTNRAAFLAAISGAQTTTFNSVTSDIPVIGSSPVLGYTFTQTGTVESSFVSARIDASPFNYNALNGVDNSTFLNTGGLTLGSYLTIGIGSSVGAFGFDTFNFDIDDERSQVTIGAQVLGLTPATRGQTGFLGFVAAPGNTFSSVRITAQAGSVFNGFDNFTIGNPFSAAVPEPSSWAMMIFGFGAIGGSLRRRRTTVAYA